MKRILKNSIALAVSLLSATSAQAITYIGNRSIGAGTVQLSITTDNTLGGLTPTNIVDWAIHMSSGAENVSLFGNNSRIAMLNTRFQVPEAGNSPLTATATDLFFNFDGDAVLLFQLGPPFDAQPAYCLEGDTPNLSCIGGNKLEVMFFGINAVQFSETADRSGLVTIGSVAAGGVPEPAAWALMIAGFGLVGSAARRRAKVQVTYA
jgi:PEP-CTERM motif